MIILKTKRVKIVIDYIPHVDDNDFYPLPAPVITAGVKQKVRVYVIGIKWLFDSIAIAVIVKSRLEK